MSTATLPTWTQTVRERQEPKRDGQHRLQLSEACCISADDFGSSGYWLSSLHVRLPSIAKTALDDGDKRRLLVESLRGLDAARDVLVALIYDAKECDNESADQ